MCSFTKRSGRNMSNVEWFAGWNRKDFMLEIQHRLQICTPSFNPIRLKDICIITLMLILKYLLKRKNSKHIPQTAASKDLIKWMSTTLFSLSLSGKQSKDVLCVGMMPKSQGSWGNLEQIAMYPRWNKWLYLILVYIKTRYETLVPSVALML